MPSNRATSTDRAREAVGGAVERRSQRATVVDLMKRQEAEIARCLPKGMTPERLTRIATTEINRNPRLLECTADSLLGALMLSAQTGLEPGPMQHVYLIPRRNRDAGTVECNWQIGYRGMLELARRSGTMADVQARVVHAGDEFSYAYGLNEHLEHVPHGSTGEVTHAWMLARFKDGGRFFLVLDRDEIDAARARSETGRQNEKGPWHTDFDAMARKTAIRRAEPYLPLSAEFFAAIAQDDTVHTTIKPDMTAGPGPGIIDIESWESTDPAPEPEPGAES